MSNTDNMSVAEFSRVLARLTAPPEATPPAKGAYQRKVRPTDAQKPFWSKRSQGGNKRAT